METGIIRRWQRFVNTGHGKTMIVPLDHGLSMGPFEGMGCFQDVEPWLSHRAIDGIIVHQGLMKHLVLRGISKKTAICLHLNGTSSLSEDPSEKPLLVDVEMAVRHGADAISLDLSFSPENTGRHFSLLGRVVREANHYGVPVLVMLSLKEGAYDPAQAIACLRQYMRGLCELGVTAVKLRRPSSISAMQDVLRGICRDIAVLFAGGAPCDERVIVEMTAAAVALGAQGMCVGRTIFQNPSPEAVLSKLEHVLFGAAAERPFFEGGRDHVFPKYSFG